MMQPKLSKEKNSVSKEKRRNINKKWILKKIMNATRLITGFDISVVKCV